MKFNIKEFLLISNNCAAGFIYNYAGIQYNNPFIWTSIYNDDFFKLIENWDNINFLNFKPSLSKYNDLLIWSATIDNKIKIYNTHYIQNNIYINPEKNGDNIYAKDILSYGNKKYIARTERMLSDKLEPLFIYDQKQFCKVSFNTIKQYLNLKTDRKLMVLTYNEKVTSKLKNSIIYLKQKNNAKVKNYSKDVFLKYFN